MKQLFKLEQIPRRPGSATAECEAQNLAEVQAWALQNVDTSTRWVVSLANSPKIIGEAIIVERYRVSGDDLNQPKLLHKTFNFVRSSGSGGWYTTPEEAWEKYRAAKPIAEAKLDKIAGRLSACVDSLTACADSFDAELEIDDMLVSVKVDGHTFHRYL